MDNNLREKLIQEHKCIVCLTGTAHPPDVMCKKHRAMFNYFDSVGAKVNPMNMQYAKDLDKPTRVTEIVPYEDRKKKDE